MTLGDAKAKQRAHKIRKPRISKLAWEYGWATPTASFKISFDARSVTFSAETGGIGSAGKGDGVHVLY
jgi:hypothetical protein